ncbi:hypothetical protein ABVK25_006075 [Lepraria finkii]|uniref:Uncharacterized protein n=1 Tax=Lepraria finkii TaxID=1340010 RepID=A0ABR4B7N1_9LECA
MSKATKSRRFNGPSASSNAPTNQPTALPSACPPPPTRATNPAAIFQPPTSHLDLNNDDIYPMYYHRHPSAAKIPAFAAGIPSERLYQPQSLQTQRPHTPRCPQCSSTPSIPTHDQIQIAWWAG